MADDDPVELLPAEPKPVVLPEPSLPMLTPEGLVEGLRALRERIPGFTQLSLRQKQSMARAGHLDPDFVDAGVQTAGAWKELKAFTGHSAEELERQREELRAWEAAERELEVVLKGIAAANLKRRHKLGRTILQLYQLVEAVLRDEADAYLRPYYERMQRAYRKILKKK